VLIVVEVATDTVRRMASEWQMRKYGGIKELYIYIALVESLSASCQLREPSRTRQLSQGSRPICDHCNLADHGR
jgi:hypothetical protein